MSTVRRACDALERSPSDWRKAPVSVLLVLSLLAIAVLGSANDPSASTVEAATLQATTIFSANFNSGTESFTYEDDTFLNTNEPSYATGARQSSGGYGGSGGLRVTLGGVNGDDIEDMSGGWERTENLSSAVTGAALSFRYKLTQEAPYESDEFSRVYVSVDGTTYDRGSKGYIDHVGGDGQSTSARANVYDPTTGWQQHQIYIGDLTAGNHTFTLGGYNSKKTTSDEITYIDIDDVVLTSGNDAPSTSDAQTLVDRLVISEFKSDIQSVASYGDRCMLTGCNLSSWTNAQNWLEGELDDMGYDVERHYYTYDGTQRSNLYVTKVGDTTPEEMYMVGAHLDGRGGGGAADDDGSGVALLMACARELAESDVETDKSVRFLFWGNEESGLNGASAYRSDRYADQGDEDPPGSGQYPEPTWLGLIQHDMILYDHGTGSPGSQQSTYADMDVEYRYGSDKASDSRALAEAWHFASGEYGEDYPAGIYDWSTNTDDTPFHDYVASISVRENRRGVSGEWINPYYHRSTDVYSSYSTDDFDLGFDTVRTTCGLVFQLAGAEIVSSNEAPTAYDQGVTTDEDTAKAITLTASDPEGDPLSYSIVTGPSNGSLSGSAPNVTYTPTADYNGSDSFTFVANDGNQNSNTATVSITVNAVNDAPVATNGSATTNEDTAKAITLVATDVDLDALSYLIVSGPSLGTLSGTAPNLTYTPDLNENGSDTFTFQAYDGAAYSNVATVSVTVVSVNDPPTVADTSGITDEDSSVVITLLGSDVEGDTLTYAVATGPSDGGVAIVGDQATYTPDPDFFGTDTFTYTAYDGAATSGSATVRVTVNPVNDAPIASDDSVTTDEDVSVGITLVATDVDPDTLTYIVVSGPTLGALSGTAPVLTYTPNLNANGADSFTFKANDGTVDSNIATVSIAVTPVNDAPVTSDLESALDEDTSVDVELGASDVDDPLQTFTFSIDSPPGHGTVDLNGGTVTYAPSANYNGTDSFTYTANDGELDSSASSVDITIHAVNDAPTADDQDVSTQEDTSVDITLTGEDVDEDPLSFSVESWPSNGTLDTSGLPVVTYTPNAGYQGPDSFEFTADDDYLTSDAAVVSITVNEVNDPPIATDQPETTAEDTATTFTLDVEDPETDPLTFTLDSSPSSGSVSFGGANPNYTATYTPGTNFNGTVTFDYTASDGQGSDSATVTIAVTAVNDAPVANAQSVSTDEDTTKAIRLTATDVEDDPLTYSISSQPATGEGSVTLAGAVATYTPPDDWYGETSFTFRANDGALNSNEATISVTVNSVNDVPVVTADSKLVDEDGTLVITLQGTDDDGPSALTFSVVSGPSHGSTSVSSPVVTYTPTANYHGADSFTYRAYDGEDYSAAATVSITVNPVNDAPVASAGSATTDEDTAEDIILSAIDVDEDALTYSIGTSPIHGSVSLDGATVTYTPDADYHGSDSFTFTASDGTLTSNEATVSITVTSVNDVPLAEDDSATVDEDGSVPILLTGSDVDEDTLTFSVLSGPTDGSLSGTQPNLTYSPDANWNGNDSFTFRAYDGQAYSTAATVSITVNPVNDAPVADGQSVSTDEDTAVSITLTGSDEEGSPLSYSVETSPTNGTLSGTAPILTYTPSTGYTGSDSFTFTVDDGDLTSSEATVSITVNASGPVFEDDFESDQGWTEDPNGTDTATTGMWERGDPQATDSSGPKQLGTTTSGSNDLVTGRLAGSSAGNYDIDRGVTTIESPDIDLPSGKDLELSFKYYLSHRSNSSSADFLRVKVLGNSTQTVFEELGAGNDDDASWKSHTADISSFAGQTVTLLVEAADAGGASLVEAAIDDVLIDVVVPATTILEADFDSSAESFTYDDDEFRSTSEPSYASGSYSSSGGYSGGGLEVDLGAIDNDDIYGMSGGWTRTFSLASEMDVSVRYYHKLTAAADYETDEYGESLLSMDGTLYGLNGNSYVARITGDGNGGDPDTTGWVLVEVDVGTLSAGSHTLIVGGYNNKKTYANEWTEVLIDELTVLGR